MSVKSYSTFIQLLGFCLILSDVVTSYLKPWPLNINSLSSISDIRVKRQAGYTYKQT